MTHKKLLWILPLMMLLLLSIAYAVGTAPNSSDSIAYYPLEDLTDSTKLYNLTLSGDTNLVAGILNNSYAFDGTDDYLKATGFSSDSTYSISVWGRPDDYADADQWIVSGGDGSGTYPDIYFGIDKRIRFGCDQADTRVRSDVNYTTGTWYHIVGVADGKDRYLYINGILVNTTLAQPADATFNSDIRIGERGNGIGDFNGTIDEVAFFNKSLNSSEVTYLFNSGSPSSDQQYPFIETILTNFTITAINTWDDSTINSFNISYDMFGTTYEYNTTTGTITTNIISNETANITITSNDYFPRTYTDYNMTTNLEAGLHQSSIGFTTQEIITNDYLNNVTYVIEGMTNTTFQLRTGLHNVTSVKEGYYNLTTTFNVTPLQSTIIALTGMYDSILNITLTSYPTGNINNFTIKTSHYNETTTNGYVELPTLQNYSNNINISSNNYTSRLNQLYTTTDILNTTNYLMYLFNSLRILIYNGTTNGLIDFQNITINTISNVTNFENTTSDGNITISFLSPISYELRFESEDFITTSYFITITDDTSTEISIYMTINTSETDIQRVKVINGGNNPIEDAIIWLQKENYGTFTTINQRVSGNDGLVSFYVNKDIDEYYRFIVIYEDEVKLTTTKTVFVPDIDDIIELEIDTETTSVNDIFSDVLGLNTTVWFTGDNDEIVNYQFIDASNKISGARLLITSTNLTDDTITVRFNTSKNGVSGIYTVSLNNTPTTLLNDTIYTIKAYITYDARDELLVYETTKTFGLSVILDRNTGLLYAVIILLFTALLTATTMKPLLSGIISLAILIPLTMIKLISVPIGIIAGFIVFFIIVFIKIRSGGNQ